ncbi:MAG: restriction endonuclease subunit S, partial [Bacteroidales bacterium]|nr:restriction endonuclease subunit S [Bacteroidales bacterium]
MKNSNIQWIGEIPDNWEVDKIKFHFRRNEPRNPGNAEVLSVYREYGVIPKNSRDDNHNVTSEDTSKYKFVRKGDLVINKMKAWQGSLAVSDYEGIVSPAYFIYNFTDEVFNKKYFHYLIRNCYKEEFRRISTGIREGQWDLPANDFENTLVLLPPLATQTSIATYLDTKCSEIDGLIADINKQIETLNELKKSTITEAVTKGLNKNAKLKDSGIQWIGMIPEGWSVTKTGYLFKEEVRRSNDSDIPLSLSQADGLIATDEMKENSLKTSSYDGWKKVLIGDLVLNRFKAHLGVMFAATIEGKVSFHYGVFKQQRPLVSKYYEFLYHTNAYKTIYAGLSNGMTVGLQNLSNQNFYSAKSLYPP